MEFCFKPNNPENIKEGDHVILTYQLEGIVKYVSPIVGCTEVFFKTKCGGGQLPVDLSEITKIENKR